MTDSAGKSANFALTRFACYFGYFSQAAVNLFLPLLYVTFYTIYGIPLSQIAVTGVINFCVQMAIDLSSAKLVDKVGYRASAIGAHALIIVGFVLLAFLPMVMNPFAGIIIGVVVYAIGGGLDEVIISPIIEICPAKNKKRQMGLLHSMYSFGGVFVIAVSTLFFFLAGTDNWWVMSLILTAVPFTSLLLFTFCPFSAESVPKNEVVEVRSFGIRELFKSFDFYIFVALILCAGASEQVIAQWVSTYAELGLGIDKEMGDIFGTMAFMLILGITRVFYSKLTDKFKVENILLVAGIIAVVAYLLASVVPNAIVNLTGCILAGVGVGALWPAVFSLASSKLPEGGTPLFSFLALGGDIGCAAGTYIIGGLTSYLSLKMSVLCAVVFPALFIVFVCVYKIRLNKTKNKIKEIR